MTAQCSRVRAIPGWLTGGAHSDHGGVEFSYALNDAL